MIGEKIKMNMKREIKFGVEVNIDSGLEDTVRSI